MPTGHGDGLAICRVEDRSQRRQPCSFLRRLGLRARRRVSPAPHSAQARVKHLVLLPSMLTLLSPFVLLSSLFYPHSSRFHDLLQIRRHFLGRELSDQRKGRASDAPERCSHHFVKFRLTRIRSHTVDIVVGTVIDDKNLHPLVSLPKAAVRTAG